MHRGRFARATITAFAATSLAVALSGCLSNPEPAPLVIATPAASPLPDEVSATTVSPTPTAGAARTRPQHPSSAPRATPKPHRVTASEVASALRSQGLPGLTVITQPSPRTRVGIDTIFYTRPSSVSRTLTVHGTRVDVSARPTSYTWSFGDGSSRTTSSPGAAYPHQTVTHRYGKAGTRYVTVTTSYAVSFRIGGGTWQTLGSFTATGPSTRLEVVTKV